MPIGSKKARRDGYVFIKVRHGEPAWRPEHVVVMETHIGRKLSRAEVVHHIDGDRANNAIENLYLCRDRSHHNDIHRSETAALRSVLSAGLVLFKDGLYEAVFSIV